MYSDRRHLGLILAALLHWCLAAAAADIAYALQAVDVSLNCPASIFQLQFSGSWCPLDSNIRLQYDDEAPHPDLPSGRRPQHSSHGTHSGDPWEVKESPGKGLGVFATRRIKAGARIMVEPALFTIRLPDLIPGQGYSLEQMVIDVDREFERLNPAAKDEFLGCHEYRLPQEAASPNKNMFIFRSNAYLINDGEVGIFPKIAKINHSCRPNAGGFWSASSKRRIILAARDIFPGEEVTTTYIPLLKTYEQRQERLNQYGFQCSCETCEAHQKTDMRRSTMGSLLETLEGELQTYTTKAMNKRLLPKAAELVQMVEEEHLMEYLPNIYHLVAELSLRMQNYDSAREWATKEVELRDQAGEDSAAAQQARELLAQLQP